MTTAASTLVERAHRLLIDMNGVRWSAQEIAKWMYDGQKEIVEARPDAIVDTLTVTLNPGARQNLWEIPAIAAALPNRLVNVIRNATGSMKPVRVVNRELIDAQVPGWYAMTPVSEIAHFMYDPKVPMDFYVYPPASSSAQVVVAVATMPTPNAISATGATYDTVTGNIEVEDIYANALLDYMLYRCYAKDGETQDVSMASAYYTSFSNALGVQLKSGLTIAPVAQSKQ